MSSRVENHGPEVLDDGMVAGVAIFSRGYLLQRVEVQTRTSADEQLQLLIQGLGFRVSGLGFKVQSFGFNSRSRV